MAVFDAVHKTVTIKIVYYGCAMGGKTTNLVTLHRLTDPNGKQGLVSIATSNDRTLFFDLLPMDLGQVGGLSVKVKLYKGHAQAVSASSPTSMYDLNLASFAMDGYDITAARGFIDLVGLPLRVRGLKQKPKL